MISCYRRRKLVSSDTRSARPQKGPADEISKAGLSVAEVWDTREEKMQLWFFQREKSVRLKLQTEVSDD